MWANAQRDGRPDEYRWRPLFNAAVWHTPTTRVPCSNAANIGQRKTWTQSELCTWQNSVTMQEPPKVYIYIVPAQKTAKHRAKFDRPPSVERRRCSNEAKTRNALKFAGCPKLANRSQPLLDRSSPYCDDLLRCCCLTSFSRLSIYALVAKI